MAHSDSTMTDESRSRDIETSSGLSSPLTSLSSLDGDNVPSYSLEPSVYSLEDDIHFAQVRRFVNVARIAL